MRHLIGLKQLVESSLGGDFEAFGEMVDPLFGEVTLYGEPVGPKQVEGF